MRSDRISDSCSARRLGVDHTCTCVEHLGTGLHRCASCGEWRAKQRPLRRAAPTPGVLARFMDTEHWSVRQLARATGIARAVIADARASTHRPNPQTLKEIGRRLDLPSSGFYGPVALASVRRLPRVQVVMASTGRIERFALVMRTSTGGVQASTRHDAPLVALTSAASGTFARAIAVRPRRAL